MDQYLYLTFGLTLSISFRVRELLTIDSLMISHPHLQLHLWWLWINCLFSFDYCLLLVDKVFGTQHMMMGMWISIRLNDKGKQSDVIRRKGEDMMASKRARGCFNSIEVNVNRRTFIRWKFKGDFSKSLNCT